jgi:hypothetical protein
VLGGGDNEGVPGRSIAQRLHCYYWATGILCPALGRYSRPERTRDGAARISPPSCFCSVGKWWDRPDGIRVSAGGIVFDSLELCVPLDLQGGVVGKFCHAVCNGCPA